MLAVRTPPRQPAARVPFRAAPWDDLHPDFRRVDQELPHDHLVRWLRRVVEQLDLTPLRRSYAGYGVLAYPPELLLAFVLFMYASAELSPAEWARRARFDDRCKWLLRGLRPSRSHLYAWRDRLGTFLDAWHQQVIAWAVAQRITTARTGSLDGTFIAALASRHRLLGWRSVDQRLWLLQQAVAVDQQPQHARALAALLGEGLRQGAALGLAWLTSAALLLLWLLLLLLQPPQSPARGALPGWLPASVAGRRRMLSRYQRAQQRLEQRLQPTRDKARLSKKDRGVLQRLKISPTDPEATLGWDKLGTYRPLYNLQTVKATDAPLVLAWELFSRNNDEGLLRPMMEKAQQQSGRSLDKVLVDGAYVSISDVRWCEEKHIEVHAPPEPAEQPSAEAAADAAGVVAVAAVAVPGSEPPDQPAAGGGPAAKAGAGKYPKGRFRYCGQEKAYYCPQGKKLPQVSRHTEKREGGVELPVLVHRAAAADCQGCAAREQCTTGKKGRVVKRYEGEEVLERLQQRMEDPARQALYQQRGQTVELGYADLKEHRGLRVFRCFGMQRARCQAGLVILATNGLNIVRILERRAREADSLAAPESQPS